MQIHRKFLDFMAYLDSLERYCQSQLDEMSNEELEAIASFFSLDWCGDEFFDEKGELKRDRCILSILLHQWLKDAEGEAMRQLSEVVAKALLQSTRALADVIWKLPLLLGDGWRSEQRDNGDWEVVHADGYRLNLYAEAEILHASFHLSKMTLGEDGRSFSLNYLLVPDEFPLVKPVQFHLPTTPVEDLAEIFIRDCLPKLASLHKVCLERQKDKFWELLCTWEVSGTFRLKKSEHPTLKTLADAVDYLVTSPNPGSELVEMIKDSAYIQGSFLVQESGDR
jgi:hypothetical protein